MCSNSNCTHMSKFNGTRVLNFMSMSKYTLLRLERNFIKPQNRIVNNKICP